jgi:hypothetical protein
MITKEQIEKASKEWARKMSNAPDKDTPDWIECDFRGGANWAIAQCPYSREDMINFGQMCLSYIPITDGYCRWNNIGWEMSRNIREIFQKWEEQK